MRCELPEGTRYCVDVVALESLRVCWAPAETLRMLYGQRTRCRPAVHGLGHRNAILQPEAGLLYHLL